MLAGVPSSDAVGREQVRRPGRQRRPHVQLDLLDQRHALPHRLQHRLHAGRRGVVDDEQAGHARILSRPTTRRAMLWTVVPIAVYGRSHACARHGPPDDARADARRRPLHRRRPGARRGERRRARPHGRLQRDDRSASARSARQLLEQLLGAIGEDTEIRPPLYVDYGTHLTIGARCFANFGLVALDVAAITIGDDVQIGPNVQLLTPTHPVEPEPRRREVGGRPADRRSATTSGSAAASSSCPGVTIGENTVVGAGSVVTRDLPANVVAVGNPARVVRSLEQP